MNTTALACYDREEIPMQKYFESYEKAKEFMEDGKKQCEESFNTFGCDLQNFEIREVK